MDRDLHQQIGDLITDATQSDDNDGNRSDLFDRYMGEPYGDEQAGQSKFVDTSVADAVEAIHPDLMEVFSGAEKIVEFQPVGAEDVDAAEQESAAVHHVFWNQNPGFEVLSVWTKEALIQQNSYVWSGWVEKDRVEVEEYADLTPEEFAQIMMDLGDVEYEFLSHSGFEVTEDEGIQFTGEPISAKIRTVSREKRYQIEPFPQEEFFITPRWNRIGLEGVPCHGRQYDLRKGQLLALGFSEDSVEKAMSGGKDDEEGKFERHTTQDSEEQEANDKTARVYEAYCIVEEDGQERLVRAWMYGDGSTPLEWEDGKEAIDEVSGTRISALTPYLIPHRHIGRAVSEIVDDIQQVKTVLTRQMLDNIYKTNWARPQFDPDLAGENTYDDLLNPAPGAPIRTSVPIEWASPQPVFQAVLPLMEMFDALKENRTGATRYNQGLDADSLNKTFGGIQKIMDASMKKLKLIARTMAETGIRDLFLRMHRDLRAGPGKQVVMRLKGQWAPINPRTWKRRTDMVAVVGMGRGDTEIRRQGLMLMGQVQEKLMGTPLVNEMNIHATIEDTAKTFGIENIDRYVNNPATMPPQPPQPQQPDPLTIQAMAQAQALQADTQIKTAKLASDEKERERAYQIKMAELELRRMELGLREIDTANKIETDEEKLDLERKKAAMDDDFKRDKLEVDALTGALDREAKTVKSEPPISYNEL